MAGLGTILAALLLVACGGAGGGTATEAPGGGAAATQGPATSLGGGAATQAPGGQTVDACALLPAADIKAVTGLDVGSSMPGPQFGIFESGCQWELVNDDAIVPPSMSLGVLASGGRDYYDRFFKPFNEEYGYEAIAGLGDEAVDAEAGSVLVVAGDAFFNLQYIGLQGDDTQLAAELGRKVVANLGG